MNNLSFLKQELLFARYSLGAYFCLFTFSLGLSITKLMDISLKQALHYDIRRGPHSVGSHVRDAAAYVCWAFGRAYYHSDMRNVLDQLAPHLLTVACYDREVPDHLPLQRFYLRQLYFHC